MVSYANGYVPASALAPLDGQPGCFLRADAANAWNRARAEVKAKTGITLMVRGWNRTYTEQVTFYLQRHRLAKAGERICCYWRGRPYKFTGTAHASPPGTSNHGWGLAVDVIDFGGVGNFTHPRRVASFPILAKHGWTDTEGRGSIREPWHLVYNPRFDTKPVSNVVGGGGSVSRPTIPGAPVPIVPEEDDDMRGLIESLYRRFVGREGSTVEVDTWTISAAESGKTPKQIVETFASARAEADTVRAAYLEFLGRGPSAVDVASWTTKGYTVKQVRDGIANSVEAKSRKG
jgi:hypothetical protein